MPGADELGANLRRRRQGLGLSLGALAQRSEVSATMLSEVERGVKNPTVKLAYSIARALECTLTELLEEPAPAPVAVVRAAERQTLDESDTGVVRHGLSPALSAGRIELAWYELPPHTSTGELGPNRPGLVEHLTVLEGAVDVVLGGVRTRLHLGDSISYGPQGTTEYRNEGETEARFSLVVDSARSPEHKVAPP